MFNVDQVIMKMKKRKNQVKMKRKKFNKKANSNNKSNSSRQNKKAISKIIVNRKNNK